MYTKNALHRKKPPTFNTLNRMSLDSKNTESAQSMCRTLLPLTTMGISAAQISLS